MRTLALLIGALISIPVLSQDPVFISGSVTDINTGFPVAGHEVYLISGDSAFTASLTTNAAGLFADTLFIDVSPANYLYFYTYDCLQQMHDTVVSLNAFEVFVNFRICTDTLYIKYDLGGSLFAGDYPINNPESNGDTARAILYRVFSDQYYPVDTMIFHDLGYYWFTFVPEGNYIIKTQLCTNSPHFGEYAPAYFGDTLQWQSASVITLDRNIYDADIHLIRLHQTDAGPGSIQGSILFGEPQDFFRSGDIQVFLFDEQNHVLEVQYTDNDGFYRFADLALGTYKVLAEQTGLYAQPVEIVLTEEYMDGSVNLLLYENDVFSIETTELESPPATIRNIFPNPATDHTQVDLRIRKEIECSLTMVSCNGKVVFIGSYHFLPGDHSVGIPCAGLAPGLYLIRVNDSNGELIDSEKIIK